MAVSRKDFEAVAEIIEAHLPAAVASDFDAGFERGITNVAKALAIHFAGENPRFDRGQFLAACGVQA